MDNYATKKPSIKVNSLLVALMIQDFGTRNTLFKKAKDFHFL